jgi:hypothetical protein
MSPDPLQQAWQAQAAPARLTLDADRLLAEVRRNHRALDAVIFWRDVREVGVSVLLIPVWILMGVCLALPFTWYLTVPVLVWIAGFLLMDRLRHRPPPAAAAEPIVQCLRTSLAEVEHQIRLLGSVLWWYLLPPGVSTFLFLGDVAWRTGGGRWAAVPLAGAVALVGLVFLGIYRLNQAAVRAELEPRRQELLTLLADLQERPAEV